MKKIFHQTKRGFTLIELLVVIAIIALLASIVLASLNSARRKSRDARRISDIQQIRTALELYFDNNSSYPVGADITPLVTQGFLPQRPTDPLLSTLNYNYQALTGLAAACAAAPCPSYHLGATLADRNNSALGNDSDFAGPTFQGTSAAAEGAACNTTAGVAYGSPGNTETCYDIRP